MEKVKIGSLKENPNNPRYITESKFKKLVKSIKKFPEMLEKRPIVVDENLMVLGGNMRLRACKEAGLKQVYISVAKNWSDEKKNEFIVKDNIGYGEWDWDILANEWDVDQLDEWGLDVPKEDEEKELVSKKIVSPQYEIKGENPDVNELYNVDKANYLIDKIEKMDIDDDVKRFLIYGANRHVVFNYEKIAEFYAHADKDIQELMEDSALILIDLNSAIDKGFVDLTYEFGKLFESENEV